MPQTTIPIGRPFEMTVDIVYALPPRHLKFSVQGGGTLEYSNDGATWTAVAVGTDLVGAFLRSITDDSLIQIT